MDGQEAEARIRSLENVVSQLSRAVVELGRRQGLRVVITQASTEPAPQGARQSAIAHGPARGTIAPVAKLEPAVRTRRGPQL